MTQFAVGLGLGLVLGWVFLKRPQWIEAALAWIKAKLGWS